MRRPKHTTAKARTRASYERLWLRNRLTQVLEGMKQTPEWLAYIAANERVIQEYRDLANEFLSDLKAA